MTKKFVEITQTYNTIAIMDIKDDETYDDIQKRILQHINHNGGPETIINYGGKIEHRIMNINRDPDKEDEQSFECID